MKAVPLAGCGLSWKVSLCCYCRSPLNIHTSSISFFFRFAFGHPPGQTENHRVLQSWNAYAGDPTCALRALQNSTLQQRTKEFKYRSVVLHEDGISPPKPKVADGSASEMRSPRRSLIFANRWRHIAMKPLRRRYATIFGTVTRPNHLLESSGIERKRYSPTRSGSAVRQLKTTWWLIRSESFHRIRRPRRALYLLQTTPKHIASVVVAACCHTQQRVPIPNQVNAAIEILKSSHWTTSSIKDGIFAMRPTPLCHCRWIIRSGVYLFLENLSSFGWARALGGLVCEEAAGQQQHLSNKIVATHHETPPPIEFLKVRRCTVEWRGIEQAGWRRRDAVLHLRQNAHERKVRAACSHNRPMPLLNGHAWGICIYQRRG